MDKTLIRTKHVVANLNWPTLHMYWSQIGGGKVGHYESQPFSRKGMIMTRK